MLTAATIGSMLGKLFGKFRRKGVLVPGTDALLEGEARKVDIGDPMAGGVQVLLCRVDGEVHALDSACPHDGGRIQPGPLLEGRHALCPLHNYKFDPRDGKAIDVACRSAKTYPVKEHDGQCEVFV